MTNSGMPSRAARWQQAVTGLVAAVRGSPLGARLAHGAFWSLAAAIIARGIAVVVAIPVGRMLGKEALGAYGVVQATIALFGMPASFAAGTAATKYIAEFRHASPERARRVIALSMISGVAAGGLSTVALGLGAPWLSSRTLGDAALGPLLQGAALLVLLNGITLAQSSSLAGLEAFRPMARTGAAVGLLSAPILLASAALFGLRGAIGALVASQAIAVVLNHALLRRVATATGVGLGLGGWASEWRTVLRFSVPLVLTGILSAPVTWACTAMLVNAPSGYAEMGIVNAAAPFFAIVVFVGGNLSQGLFPGLSDAFARADLAALRQVVRALLAVAAAVSVPLAVLGSLASPWLIGLYGPEFRQGWPVLAITFATAATYSFHLVFSQLLLAAGAVTRWFWLHVVWSAAQLALTYGLLRWGAVGFSLARLGSFLIAAGVGAWLMLPGITAKQVAPAPGAN